MVLVPAFRRQKQADLQVGGLIYDASRIARSIQKLTVSKNWCVCGGGGGDESACTLAAQA